MAKKDDQMKIVTYVLVAFVAGVALMYLLAFGFFTPRLGTMGPGMMWGQGDWGMMHYMQQYRNTVNIDCNAITTEGLVEIGDDVMDQMIGDEKIHERIDETHPNIDAMHLMMGRIATGCY